MPLELVRCTTPDGLKLDGAWQAARGTGSTAPVDLAICVYGVASNFYSPGLFETLADLFCERGIAALRVNTRGHDNVFATTSKSGRGWYGAAFEVVDECRHDVAGWLNWAEQAGYRKVALVGHSLGAIKALYATSHEPRESIHRVIAISPPRLSHSFFREGLDSARYFQTLTTAQELVKTGRGQELFLSGYPFPLYITGTGYIDKYGPDERYNFFRFLERIDVPVLFTYGERELEGSAAFAGIVEAIAAIAKARDNIRVTTIPRADHNYTAQHGALGEAVLNWLGGENAE